MRTEEPPTRRRYRSPVCTTRSYSRSHGCSRIRTKDAFGQSRNGESAVLLPCEPGRRPAQRAELAALRAEVAERVSISLPLLVSFTVQLNRTAASPLFFRSHDHVFERPAIIGKR